MRRVLLILCWLSLAGVAPAADSTPASELEFLRRRAAVLEADNERLRALIKTRDAADATAADAAKRVEIEHDVERLRQLQFLHPVVFREIPRADLPKVLSQKLSQQIGEQEFTKAGIALSALGLLPEGIDLKKTYLDLLGEQIGAFYDQHATELFTFTEHPLTNAQNRVIMAHELTHALEDQHFDLQRLPIEAHDNDDRALAATALVEGDATLVMNNYMIGDLSSASMRDAFASAFTTDVRQLAAAPRYLRETLLFPYLRGQEFCATLFAQGGWPALDRAFAQPPSSTAQILHPELYLAQPRVEPVGVDFGDASTAEHQPLDVNVLGEFGLRQLLARWLHDDARASAAAAGWAGDRYAVYQVDGKASYAWKIVCRDAGAAATLQTALRDVASAMPGRQMDVRTTDPKTLLVIKTADPKWHDALLERFAQ